MSDEFDQLLINPFLRSLWEEAVLKRWKAEGRDWDRVLWVTEDDDDAEVARMRADFRAVVADLERQRRAGRRRARQSESRRTRYEWAVQHLLGKAPPQDPTDEKVAEALGVTEDTIGRWRDAGDID